MDIDFNISLKAKIAIPLPDVNSKFTDFSLFSFFNVTKGLLHEMFWYSLGLSYSKLLSKILSLQILQSSYFSVNLII